MSTPEVHLCGMCWVTLNTAWEMPGALFFSGSELLPWHRSLQMRATILRSLVFRLGESFPRRLGSIGFSCLARSMNMSSRWPSPSGCWSALFFGGAADEAARHRQ